MRIWRRQGGVTPEADFIPKRPLGARNGLLYAGLRSGCVDIKPIDRLSAFVRAFLSKQISSSPGQLTRDFGCKGSQRACSNMGRRQRDR